LPQVAAEGLSLSELVRFAEQHAARLEDPASPAAAAPVAAPAVPLATPQPASAAPPGSQVSLAGAATAGGQNAAAATPAPAPIAGVSVSAQEAADTASVALASGGGGVVALHYDEAQRARNLGTGGNDERIERLRKLNNWVRKRRENKRGKEERLALCNCACVPNVYGVQT